MFKNFYSAAIVRLLKSLKICRIIYRFRLALISFFCQRANNNDNEKSNNIVTLLKALVQALRFQGTELVDNASVYDLVDGGLLVARTSDDVLVIRRYVATEHR